MLDDFAERIAKLQAFDFGQALQTAVEDNADKLPSMIREQLEEGKDGNDKPNTIFGRNGYSPRTVEIKQANGVGLGAVTDRVTNYMTGAFYESLEMKTEGQLIEADSDVPYFGDITLYSDGALLDVDKDHRLEFAENYTMPSVEAQLLEKTGIVVTKK